MVVVFFYCRCHGDDQFLQYWMEGATSTHYSVQKSDRCKPLVSAHGVDGQERGWYLGDVLRLMTVKDAGVCKLLLVSFQILATSLASES